MRRKIKRVFIIIHILRLVHFAHPTKFRAKNMELHVFDKWFNFGLKKVLMEFIKKKIVQYFEKIKLL